MDCKETNKKISDFLNHELSSRELRGFMEHISHCDDCREELSIQFLLQEGMARLEEGNTLDLQNELERLLEDAEKRILLRKWLHYFVYGIEVLAILTILTIIILVIVL